MDTIKEMLRKDFPGRITVLPEAIRDRLMELFDIYPLPVKDQEELICYISNLPDDQMEGTLTEFEEVAVQLIRENGPLS